MLYATRLSANDKDKITTLHCIAYIRHAGAECWHGSEQGVVEVIVQVWVRTATRNVNVSFMSACPSFGRDWDFVHTAGSIPHLRDLKLLAYDEERRSMHHSVHNNDSCAEKIQFVLGQNETLGTVDTGD